jgi:hypothetical protein
MLGSHNRKAVFKESARGIFRQPAPRLPRVHQAMRIGDFFEIDLVGVNFFHTAVVLKLLHDFVEVGFVENL